VFRAESGLKVSGILLLLMAATGLAFSASPDRHVQDDPGAVLYRQSAFAHGFIHGYEDGFHEGDEDYQLARTPRELKSMSEFHSADGGYRSEYGDKELFRAGYREGLDSGYQDAYRGRAFRAISVGRAISQGLAQATDRRSFEMGFTRGYRSVRLATAGATSNSARESNDCGPGAGGPGRQPLSSDFCRGYLQGSSFAHLYEDGRAGGTLALQQAK
jgi:hypothetical protein